MEHDEQRGGVGIPICGRKTCGMARMVGLKKERAHNDGKSF